MPEAKRFSGPYVRMNEAMLRERANRSDDPRSAFYKAMMSARTYEEYYQLAGEVSVRPATYKTKPVTPHMEIRYARNDCRWIADAKEPS